MISNKPLKVCLLTVYVYLNLNKCRGQHIIINHSTKYIMDRDLIAHQTIPDEVLIPNFDQFKQKLKAMKVSGTDHLQIIADYDLTLTRYSTNNIRGCSTYQLIQSSVLKGDHADYIQSLYNYYHPIEIDPNIPHETKQKLMHEWWDKSNQALLDESFLSTDLSAYIINSTLHFRHGIKELISHINNKSIPLTIISGGIGNLIEESLKFVETNIKNLQIFSNFIAFNEQGKSSHFSLPEVRTDKSRVLVGTSVKKNLILLGDLPAVMIK